MKKLKEIIILFIAIAFAGCDNSEVQKLQKRISELEGINSELKDSISKVNRNKLSKAEIISTTTQPNFKIGDTAKVKFKFTYPETLSAYNVYTTKDGIKPDSLLLSNLTTNEFSYEFVPEKLGVEIVDLITVFKLNDGDYVSMNIPVRTGFKIIE